MVSLAETHLKLLFSADTEERELQGFTLVQLLLVRTIIEPCFMDTSSLQTVFLVPGESKPSHFPEIRLPWYGHPVIYRHSPWLPQCLFWLGLTLPLTKNNLLWCLWKKREESLKLILQTWIYESCHYSHCLEILRFDSFMWTMSKCPVKYFTWLKIRLVSCDCSLTLLKNSLTWYQPLLEILLLFSDLLRALRF